MIFGKSVVVCSLLTVYEVSASWRHSRRNHEMGGAWQPVPTFSDPQMIPFYNAMNDIIDEGAFFADGMQNPGIGPSAVNPYLYGGQYGAQPASWHADNCPCRVKKVDCTCKCCIKHRPFPVLKRPPPPVVIRAPPPPVMMPKTRHDCHPRRHIIHYDPCEEPKTQQVKEKPQAVEYHPVIQDCDDNKEVDSAQNTIVPSVQAAANKTPC